MKEVEQLLKSLEAILEKEAKGENIDKEVMAFDNASGQWKLEKGLKSRLSGVFGAMKDRVSKMRNKPKAASHEDTVAAVRGEAPHPDLGTTKNPKYPNSPKTNIPIPRRPGDELRPHDPKPSHKPLNIPIHQPAGDSGHAAAADAHHSAAKAHLSAAKVHHEKSGRPAGMPEYPKTDANRPAGMPPTPKRFEDHKLTPEQGKAAGLPPAPKAAAPKKTSKPAAKSTKKPAGKKPVAKKAKKK